MDEPLRPQPLDSNANATDDSVASRPIKDRYYLDLVTFLVEDRSSRVPKYHFESSEFFVPLLQEGDESVVTLEGITKDEFTLLLKVLFPRDLEIPRLSLKDCLFVMNLATKWNLSSAWACAIHYITLIRMHPLDMLELAQTYSEVELLRAAFVRMLRRTWIVSPDEANIIGFDLAIKVCRAQEQAVRIIRKTLEARNLVCVAASPFEKSGIVMEDSFWNELVGGVVSVDPIERLILARTYGVHELLKSALVDLIERPKSISLEESKRLGRETTFKLWHARLRYLFSFHRLPDTPYYLDCDIDYAAIVDEVFRDELEAMEVQGRKFRQISTTTKASVNSDAEGVKERATPSINLVFHGC
ncbi:hypothetical protein Hypma_001593 [Hypsizygus marmoreus]|uniref:BTB domain-containing protein n=1 Tax=Hypsizygus marmoreus TaxID=39966 RepID=A0A369JAH9_HYPMA|nr:hypothetical protein Hypma_001593 [Hypsizygus marmoreus]